MDRKQLASALRALTAEDIRRLREKFLYRFHLNTDISRLPNLEAWIIVLTEYLEETSEDPGP